MKTLCLIIIAVVSCLIFDRLGEISRKLDKPAFVAGEYRPNLRGGLQ